LRERAHGTRSDHRRRLAASTPISAPGFRPGSTAAPGAAPDRLVDAGDHSREIIHYEAVHEIRDWADLRARIDPPDRRCYAFFHPALVDER